MLDRVIRYILNKVYEGYKRRVEEDKRRGKRDTEIIREYKNKGEGILFIVKKVLIDMEILRREG
jgi:hypothetical protein